MANTKLPPVPYNQPIAGSLTLSPAWAKWFRDLFLRVGQTAAPSNSDLAGTTGLDALQAQVAELQDQINSISVEGLNVGPDL